MTEPERLLVAGDTHGNPEQILYLGQVALDEQCQAIMQVGDYGYWEHLQGGAAFLDVCSEVATENDLPIFWIDGNHENHTMLRALYGPGGPRYKPTPEGFWEIRPGVYYIPRGTRWNWTGVEIMGLGGAYSIDKGYRLNLEKEQKADLQRHLANRWHLEGRRRETQEAFKKWGHTAWWPEEEISQAELQYALRDQRPLDLLFTHDKPRRSNPDWNRKDFFECYPNQDKVQQVVTVLRPKVLIHGHLHYNYTDQIRSSGDAWTTVRGLSNEGQDKQGKFRPDPASWMVLDLKPLAG